MKDKIHPAYYPAAKVICACGNSFTVGSTKEKIEVEVCSACHPFFTGRERFVDTAGRVEKFKARAAKRQEIGARQATGQAKKSGKPKKK